MGGGQEYTVRLIFYCDARIYMDESMDVVRDISFVFFFSFRFIFFYVNSVDMIFSHRLL